MKKTTTTPRSDRSATTTPRKNLQLRLRTLRVLDSAELRLVQGGLKQTTDTDDPNVSRTTQVNC